MTKLKSKTTVFDVALVALMVAVIEVCKVAMMGLPNIELTSFWLILFSKHFGKKVYFVVPVFILLEGALFGFGLWWVMYLYAWPCLVFVTRIFRKSDNAFTWAMISAVFGLMFGALCAIPYFFTGTDVKSGLTLALNWWIAGIPWDIAHCAGNFVLMMLLYKPMGKAIDKVKTSKFVI